MNRLKLFVLLLAAFGVAEMTWAQTPAEPEPDARQTAPRDTVEITARELADRLVEYAETFLGTPYRYGANGPKRFDCTAYTRYVYKHFGYHNLRRSSKDQAHDGREVDISDLHNLQKGDILVIGSRRNPKVPGHAAIFIELDSTGRDPKFIHASKRGVRYSTVLTERYYANRLLGARRILPDFEDYDVHFDSTATYAFDTETGVHVAPDSLVLSPADRRIVLFENGKWACVSEDGTISVPENGGRIILSGDGNWAPVREAKVLVPAAALKEEQEQPQQPEPEKIYYTIKEGDTLSGIAKRHHTTVNQLCRLNGITARTILKVGRKLRVK